MNPKAAKPNYADLAWNADYAGNPFIEALGEPRDATALAKELERNPGVPANVRTLTPMQRVHVIESMNRIFLPRTTDLELAMKADLLMRQGYVVRNPLDQGYEHHLYTVKQEAIKRFKSRAIVVGGSTTYPATLAYGPSGNGKSTGLRRVAALFAELIEHVSYHGTAFSYLQIPVVYLCCSFNGSPRGIALAFFAAVDAITGTTNYWEQYRGQHPVEELIGAMAQVIATFNIGLVIIDEIQHLENYKQGHDGNEGLDFLIKLSNALFVPMILAGTYRAVSLVESRFQNARRVCDGGSTEYALPANPQDREWRHAYLPGIWRYQYTPQYFVLTDERAEWYFRLTQGVASIDVLLFKLVQQRAARQAARAITEADFVHVYAKQLRPVHKILKVLADRHTNPDALKKYEDIYPSHGGLVGLLAPAPGTGNKPLTPDAAGPTTGQAVGTMKGSRPAAPRKSATPGPALAPDKDDLRNVVVEEDRVAALRQLRSMELDAALELPPAGPIPPSKT
jgi:hypothetical protein